MLRAAPAYTVIMSVFVHLISICGVKLACVGRPTMLTAAQFKRHIRVRSVAVQSLGPHFIACTSILKG